MSGAKRHRRAPGLLADQGRRHKDLESKIVRSFRHLDAEAAAYTGQILAAAVAGEFSADELLDLLLQSWPSRGRLRRG